MTAAPPACFPARDACATWAIENQAREIDVQYLLGNSMAAMVRRAAATYDSAKALETHRAFIPVTWLAARWFRRGSA